MRNYLSILRGVLFTNVMLQIAFCKTTEEPIYCPYCKCTFSSVNGIIMNCKYVENEEQLDYVFTTATFPVLLVNTFKIVGNTKLKYISRNVFGDVSFENIYFANDAIEYVDETAFSNSKSTLLKWVVYDCWLLPQGFPFDTVNLYTKLSILHLESAGIFNILPRISSNSLEVLWIHNCQVTFLHYDAFSYVPNLNQLDLGSNNLTVIPPGIFDNNELLKSINFMTNDIEILVTGNFWNLPYLVELNLSFNHIFHIEPVSFYNLPKLQYLFLNYNYLPYFLFENVGYLPSLIVLKIGNNAVHYIDRDVVRGCSQLQVFRCEYSNITSIEPGTFSGLKSAVIDFFNSSLTTLNEDWLRPVLENNNSVDLSQNALDCDCDMAWLYDNVTLLNLVTGQCQNGTFIQELDSSLFADC